MGLTGFGLDGVTAAAAGIAPGLAAPACGICDCASTGAAGFVAAGPVEADFVAAAPVAATAEATAICRAVLELPIAEDTPPEMEVCAQAAETTRLAANAKGNSGTRRMAMRGG